MGNAMSSPSRPAVATWYSSGWNVWWLRASSTVTSTGASRRWRAAARPPNPAPTTTTWWRFAVAVAAVMGRPPARATLHKHSTHRNGGPQGESSVLGQARPEQLDRDRPGEEE